MEKVWYIKVNGSPEGPFSIPELKRDRRITPDTLVWREGFKKWVAIRYVLELKEVFADEEGQEKEKPSEDKTLLRGTPDREEIALDLRKDPPYFWLLLIIIAVIIYLISQIL